MGIDDKVTDFKAYVLAQRTAERERIAREMAGSERITAEFALIGPGPGESLPLRNIRVAKALLVKAWQETKEGGLSFTEEGQIGSGAHKALCQIAAAQMLADKLKTGEQPSFLPGKIDMMKFITRTELKDHRTAFSVSAEMVPYLRAVQKELRAGKIQSSGLG